MCSATAAVMIGVALVSGYMQYDASKQSQRYNEAVAEQNSKVAGAQAIDAERLGQIEEGERRMRMRLQIAQQETQFASQNVAPTGSALDILGQTAMFGEADIGRIRSNAQRKAWGFRYEQYNIEANKRMAAFKGKTERQGIVLSTVGNVTSAAAGGFGNTGGGT